MRNLSKRITETAKAIQTPRTTSDDPTPEYQLATKLLTPHQVSELIGVSEKTLANWRWKGSGPSFVKLSGRSGKGAVRYRLHVLSQWISGSTRTSTSDQREVVGGEK